MSSICRLLRQASTASLLSGLLHHLPDPARCVAEVFRVLKPGGTFVAFDPNRMNPFMYLYRDHSSPLYSPVGVTENERPGAGLHRIAAVFKNAGFTVGTDYYVRPELSLPRLRKSRVGCCLPIMLSIAWCSRPIG